MMQFLLDHLIGILRPIGPHHWAIAIRGLRRAEGWWPPMMLIAAMGTLFFIGQGFGLLGGVLAVKIFNWVAIATWLVVGLIASLAVTIDGISNFRRLGIRGIVRPRWWFELARLTWMLFLLGALSLPLLHFSGIPPLSNAGDHLFRALPAIFVIFMFFGTIGYLVSALSGRRPHGRAFECVEYFYWILGSVVAVTMFVVWLPAKVRWAQPLTLTACVVAASLMGIVLLKVGNRWQASASRKKRR
jgi:hypothetical protein